MNLASIIDEHAPDATALIFNNRATTYGELRDQVDHCRGGLPRSGVESGDRVALLCSNGVHFVVVYLAALGLGAVTVPLNPTSPAPELQSQIAIVGAKVVVVERASAVTLGERRSGGGAVGRRGRHHRSGGRPPGAPAARSWCRSIACWPANPSSASTCRRATSRC